MTQRWWSRARNPDLEEEDVFAEPRRCESGGALVPPTRDLIRGCDGRYPVSPILPLDAESRLEGGDAAALSVSLSLFSIPFPLSLSLLSSLFFDDLPLESTIFLPCLPFSHPRPLPRSSAPLPFASCLPAQRPARREPSFVGVHLPSLSLSLSLSLLSPYFSFSSRGRRYGEPRDLPSSSHHPGWLDGTNKRAQNTRRNSSNREFLFPLFEQMPWC